MWILTIAETVLHVFWSKIDSSHVDVALKVFNEEDNKKFELVQNLTIGKGNFYQFMLFRKQLVLAPEIFGREENLSPVLIPTKSKDVEEQLLLAQKEVDVMD